MISFSVILSIFQLLIKVPQCMAHNELIPPESLLPFYVYVLADPMADNAIFYVGMGCNQRVLHHWGEVKARIESQQFPTHPKHHRMMKIAAEGLEPIQTVIGRFESRDEAYAVESTLINWVYGFDNLTNMNRGHNANQIRPFGVWEMLPYIDVERPNYDGGQMTIAPLHEQSRVWVARNGPSAEMGMEIFDYLNDYAQRNYDELLRSRGLRTNHRVVASRITFFLDDLTNPARPERRQLPNPLCRIRMDGATNQTTLQLEFTKAESTVAETIFDAVLDEMKRLGLRLSQPDSPSRYDLLVPISSSNDKEFLLQIMKLGFDSAIKNGLT